MILKVLFFTLIGAKVLAIGLTTSYSQSSSSKSMSLFGDWQQSPIAISQESDSKKNSTKRQNLKSASLGIVSSQGVYSDGVRSNTAALSFDLSWKNPSRFSWGFGVDTDFESTAKIFTGQLSLSLSKKWDVDIFEAIKETEEEEASASSSSIKLKVKIAAANVSQSIDRGSNKSKGAESYRFDSIRTSVNFAPTDVWVIGVAHKSYLYRRNLQTFADLLTQNYPSTNANYLNEKVTGVSSGSFGLSIGLTPNDYYSVDLSTTKTSDLIGTAFSQDQSLSLSIYPSSDFNFEVSYSQSKYSTSANPTSSSSVSVGMNF